MAIRRLPSVRARIGAVILGLAAAQSVSHAQQSATSDDAYLDQLEGHWDMVGTLRGKPVQYRASGERVLQGGFLELHMIDASPKPTYEADVFLGYDKQAGDYIAHWLDRFGAAGSRVVATGMRDGPRLVIQFPYAAGAFRDTFVWNAQSRSWSLLLESQGSDGAWSNFASYTLTRAKKAPGH